MPEGNKEVDCEVLGVNESVSMMSSVLSVNYWVSQDSLYDYQTLNSRRQQKAHKKSVQNYIFRNSVHRFFDNLYSKIIYKKYVFFYI